MEKERDDNGVVLAGMKEMLSPIKEGDSVQDSNKTMVAVPVQVSNKTMVAAPVEPMNEAKIEDSPITPASDEAAEKKKKDAA
eukprot:CAMPEP_0172541250 /NCGR_PEP_ID=MMETSP1067-20121228/12091_1 /TAXON_ID=265564 ORGANISM="Thalassiosira punctigera, Strain Tpunct2005C2" /NCGR_SAMPLE_ID=MMETSP1067 /ASSEMBLY_ACC=CAM_ASM_000444 /LENGTH=81 /DNA_ID=CAMNT_0013327253 /DNA_START=23 /DNA_END=264 /DNA_ORIENTATION=-